MSYESFLGRKAVVSVPTGFEPDETLLSEQLFPFQADIVRWACRRGRAALFEDCGLGKTAQQLSWAEQVVGHTGKNVLALAPLCVAEQTVREGEKFGIEVTHANEQADIRPGINVTNYQKLHRFDLSTFGGLLIDESSILKSYDGTTRNEIISRAKQIPYKLPCTATPAPNDFTEIGNHCEFLGVMSRVEMLATFFVHDGGDTSKWRLKGHAEAEFWKWLCGWAVNLRRPSDLGYEDAGFSLPELRLKEHCVEAKSAMPGFLFPLEASTLAERREARKASIGERVALASELAASDGEQWLLWCNLNAESEAIAKAIPGAVEVAGHHDDEHKARSMMGFTDGSVRVLVTKPSIAGFGMNWQHCARMAFVGLSDSYEQFYQAIRRCWRFGQCRPVEAHIITSSAEGAVLENIKRKESDSRRMAEEMVRHMADISSVEIKGITRQTFDYSPSMPMALPGWVRSGWN